MCVSACENAKKKAPSIFPLHERWQRGKIAREIAIRRRLCVVLDPTVDASLHSQLIRFKRAGQRDCSLRENLISVFDFSSTHNYTQAKEERIDKVAIFIFIFILFSSFLSLHLSALPLLLLLSLIVARCCSSATSHQRDCLTSCVFFTAINAVLRQQSECIDEMRRGMPHSFELLYCWRCNNVAENYGFEEASS